MNPEEIPFHEAKLKMHDKVTLTGGIITDLPGERRVEVWRVVGHNGLCLRFYTPILDGKTSCLVFGLEDDSAKAVASSIAEHFTGEPAEAATNELLNWLRKKLADAEQALRVREEMANPPSISEEEIERIKSLPGTRVTKSRKLSKAEAREILADLARHRRIAEKNRQDVKMFKAVIAAISKPT